MNAYLRLLIAFQALSRVPRPTTFMEVSGYPHYENVCSNILGFFFDPHEEHGLGNLLLTAFLKMTNHAEVEIPSAVTISREYVCEQDKRIDLVIDCESFTLGIENKIYHWEANDFGIYERALAVLGANKEVIKAVLCLRTSASDPQLKGGFKRYTYSALWHHVRDLLGHHFSKAAPKWVIYLNDFMETTTRLSGENPDDKELADFFMQHHGVIERLFQDRQKLLNRMAERIRNLTNSMETLADTKKHLQKRWIYQTYTLASHFHILGAEIGLNLDALTSGWCITLFRLNGSQEVLLRLKSSPSIAALCPNPSLEGERYVLQRFDLHADEVVLQDALVGWYTALIAAADSLSISNPL